jgi:hypothetical protein
MSRGNSEGPDADAFSHCKGSSASTVASCGCGCCNSDAKTFQPAPLEVEVDADGSDGPVDAGVVSGIGVGVRDVTFAVCFCRGGCPRF